ncbi:MAG: hypothetical protein HY560_12895, partial [Gemmatimonadetes bacterium]|nr:hypothetical protein [Gemmatimonadota bacterium]
VGTLRDPAFDHDIWLVPVAINYDRVLEDRVLTRELLQPGSARRGRLRQLGSVLRYLIYNLARWLTGTLRRYGAVAVNFGTPASVRAWLAQHAGVLDAPKEERLPKVQALADEVMRRIGTIIPVTPVPLVSAALLSFGDTIVRRDRLLERLDEYRKHLVQTDAKLMHAERGVYAILDRGARLLCLRRVIYQEEDALVMLPTQRPLLEFYANSIRHLLPVTHPVPEGELLRHRAIAL